MHVDDYGKFTEFLLEKKVKYGYIKENDKMGLAKVFNTYMEKIYNNIISLFGINLVINIYPDIYKDILSTMYMYMDMGYNGKDFKKEFCFLFDEVFKSVIRKKKIDVLSDGYLLSTGNYSDIGKTILFQRIPSIILESNSSLLDRYYMNVVCSKSGISKIRYKLESNKIDKEIMLLKANTKNDKSYQKK